MSPTVRLPSMRVNTAAAVSLSANPGSMTTLLRYWRHVMVELWRRTSSSVITISSSHLVARSLSSAKEPGEEGPPQGGPSSPVLVTAHHDSAAQQNDLRLGIVLHF